jgi:prepilin-type N-terminal cleavage/methylation domain-containing protein
MTLLSVLNNNKCAMSAQTVHTNKGFTLIELVLVLVVLGLLYVVVMPRATDNAETARHNVTDIKLTQIKKSIMGDASVGYEGFWTHMRRFPTQVEGLNVLRVQGALAAYNPTTDRGWAGPYINSPDSDSSGLVDCFEDAWGNAIVYNAAARTLTSWGENEAAGGGDDIVVMMDTNI